MEPKKQKKYAPEARIPTKEFVKREAEIAYAQQRQQRQQRAANTQGHPVDGIVGGVANGVGRTVGGVTQGVGNTVGHAVGGVNKTLGDTTKALGKGDVLGTVGGVTGGLGQTVGGVGKGLVSRLCFLFPVGVV